MFKHILVPLDGSKLAESVLPAAAYLASALNSKVTLIHIIEQDAPTLIHGERHLTRPEEAEPYLEEVARRVFGSGTRVSCHVHLAATRDVATGILAHQDELSPDLIVMCTHGHGGLRRMLFGRIAQQVVAAGTTPLLLIRPRTGVHETSFECRTLLAPTDGNPDHSKGLDVAFNLARSLNAWLYLLGVIPTWGTLSGRDVTTGRFMPATSRAVLEIAEEDLKSYLHQQAKPFQKAGVHASIQVLRGNPAPIIVETAEAMDASIIVLGTHGKAGPEAFWAGSVGATVLAHTERPLLLVPV